MRIFNNGECYEIPAGSTIADLLQQLELEPRYVAVEVNFELVPRGEHLHHRLRDGDRLEIVTLVGGG